MDLSVITSALTRLTRTRRDDLADEIRREAMYYATVIVERLTQLGICYRSSARDQFGQPRGTQRVRFLRAVGTPEAIYLLVDTRRLPYGVRLGALDDQDILADLSVACRRQVRFRCKTDAGAWFVIERASGISGVPRHVGWSSIMSAWPEVRRPLVVPLGSGENRRLLYRSLAGFPHALVGGSTGSGKTTLLHTWICALVSHNTPQDLGLVLIDLKGGVEFSRYKHLPHLLHVINPDCPGAVVRSGDDVEPVLTYLHALVGERLALFERDGTESIVAYNYRHKARRLPRVVLIVDELAALMLDRELKRGAERVLADITARGRAAGVHVVLATQRPERAVVTGLIKSNLDARMAFRVPDNVSSMIILDTGEASKLGDDAPPGRYVYRYGLERYECQAPYISSDEIAGVIAACTTPDDTQQTQAVAVTDDEIFLTAINQLGGRFARDPIYELMRERGVTRKRIAQLQHDYVGKTLMLNGVEYALIKSSGTAPHMLVMTGSQTTDAGET